MSNERVEAGAGAKNTIKEAVQVETMSSINAAILAAAIMAVLVGWHLDRRQAWRFRHQVRTWRSGRVE